MNLSQTAPRFAPYLALGLALTSIPLTSRAADRVEIQTNQQTGTATVLIDGTPALRVSSQGLEVSGSLSFSGQLTAAPLSQTESAPHAR